MTRYPLGAVTSFSSRIPSSPISSPSHIPPVVYTEAEVFIFCSITRRAEGDPLPLHPTPWVDQKMVYPIRFPSPLLSRPLRIFPFIPFFFLVPPTHSSIAHGRFSLSLHHNLLIAIVPSHIALVTLLYAF